MTKQGRLGIIVCLFALLMGAIVGCGSCGDAAPSFEEVSLADVAKMLPKTLYEFSHIDFRQVREDDELARFYENWLEEGWRFQQVERATGLHASDIHWWTEANNFWDNVVMCGADFDLSDVREQLGVNSSQEEYQGVEVWRGGYESVAIIENMIILGTADYVEQCIDTIGGGRSSMYDDADVADVLSRLPPGFKAAVAAPSMDPPRSGSERLLLVESEPGQRRSPCDFGFRGRRVCADGRR